MSSIYYFSLILSCLDNSFSCCSFKIPILGLSLSFLDIIGRISFPHFCCSLLLLHKNYYYCSPCLYVQVVEQFHLEFYYYFSPCTFVSWLSSTVLRVSAFFSLNLNCVHYFILVNIYSSLISNLHIRLVVNVCPFQMLLVCNTEHFWPLRMLAVYQYLEIGYKEHWAYGSWEFNNIWRGTVSHLCLTGEDSNSVVKDCFPLNSSKVQSLLNLDKAG